MGLWLFPGPRTIGSITFDVHTLLYSAVAIFIGFQSISFAAFTKIFAINEGLLPPDSRLDKFFSIFTLERGLGIGGALAIMGLIASAYALFAWGQKSFGPLDPVSTLRLVIPAALALSLGCQIVLSSFFLSVLGIGRR
jgi:hypothetical protein